MFKKLSSICLAGLLLIGASCSVSANTTTQTEPEWEVNLDGSSIDASVTGCNINVTSLVQNSNSKVPLDTLIYTRSHRENSGNSMFRIAYRSGKKGTETYDWALGLSANFKEALPKGGNAMMSVDVMFPDADLDENVSFAGGEAVIGFGNDGNVNDGGGGSYSGFPVILRVTGNKEDREGNKTFGSISVDVAQGGSRKTRDKFTVTKDIKAEQWYNFTIIADNLYGMYDVYMDGVPVLLNANYRAITSETGWSNFTLDELFVGVDARASQTSTPSYRHDVMDRKDEGFVGLLDKGSTYTFNPYPVYFDNLKYAKNVDTTILHNYMRASYRKLFNQSYLCNTETIELPSYAFQHKNHVTHNVFTSVGNVQKVEQSINDGSDLYYLESPASLNINRGSINEYGNITVTFKLPSEENTDPEILTIPVTVPMAKATSPVNSALQTVVPAGVGSVEAGKPYTFYAEYTNAGEAVTYTCLAAIYDSAEGNPARKLLSVSVTPKTVNAGDGILEFAVAAPETVPEGAVAEGYILENLTTLRPVIG